MPSGSNKTAESTVTVGRKNGMHITPAVLLCKLQEEHPEAKVHIHWKEKELACDSPIRLSSAGIRFGDELNIRVTGKSADTVLDKAVKIVVSD